MDEPLFPKLETDESIPPGVVVINGQPYPIIEFDVDEDDG